MKSSSIIKEQLQYVSHLQVPSEQVDDGVIPANHFISVITAKCTVIKCMGVLLKTGDVKVHCGLITLKVTEAAVKPDSSTASLLTSEVVRCWCARLIGSV